MNRSSSSSLLMALLTLAWPSLAEAGVVAGTVRYLRDWADCSNTAGARNPCNQNGQLLPLDRVTLNLQRVSDGANNFFSAAENGTFSKSVAAGTYRLVIHYRDGTINSPGTMGNAGVALVNETIHPFTDVFDTASGTRAVPASGTITSLQAGPTPARTPCVFPIN